jgi:DNA repair protein SbcD/Mre11
MRLLHTSDWHLGRTLLGLSLLDDQAAFLDKFIDLVRDFQPELVVIVGDLFERATPSEEAIRLLDDVLRRLLLECKVRVLMAPGKQDGMQRLSFGSWMYERRQLHLVTTLEQALTPLMLEDADGPVHVNAVPYLNPREVSRHFRSTEVHTHREATAVVMDHLTRFRRLRRKAVRGLVAGYLWVEGGELCGEERELEGGPNQSGLSTQAFEGLNYAALGYLHHYQALGPDNQLVYSGSPLPYSFEVSPPPRGAVKMEMDSSGQVLSELVPLTPKRQFWRISGSLERLLLGPALRLAPNDVVVLDVLEDSGGALTPAVLQQLRGLYPNLWRVERPQSAAGGQTVEDVSPILSFRSFYQAAQGQPLDDDSRQLLEEVFADSAFISGESSA